jgi:hypothetical protein
MNYFNFETLNELLLILISGILKHIKISLETKSLIINFLYFKYEN